MYLLTAIIVVVIVMVVIVIVIVVMVIVVVVVIVGSCYVVAWPSLCGLSLAIIAVVCLFVVLFVFGRHFLLLAIILFCADLVIAIIVVVCLFVCLLVCLFVFVGGGGSGCC